MRNDILIFGKNSVLSKSFVSNCDFKTNNIIFFTRKGLKKDINCNLGELISSEEIFKITAKLKLLQKSNKKVMILFAWSGGPRNLNSIENTWSTNINITLNFIEFCKKIKPSKIIFLSSAGTLYPQNNDYKYKECDEIDLRNSYGKQKFIAEQLLINFTRGNNIDLSILRVASAYGFDSRFSDQGVINKWIYYTIANKKLTLYNSPKSKINFISFEQISVAINYCISNKVEGIYNIGTNISLSLEEILEEIKKITCKDFDIDYVSSSYRNFNIDTSKFFKKSGILFESNLKKDMKLIFKLIKDSIKIK